MFMKLKCTRVCSLLVQGSRRFCFELAFALPIIFNHSGELNESFAATDVVTELFVISYGSDDASFIETVIQ
jgi:hypothetical protein